MTLENNIVDFTWFDDEQDSYFKSPKNVFYDFFDFEAYSKGRYDFHLFQMRINEVNF